MVLVSMGKHGSNPYLMAKSRRILFFAQSPNTVMNLCGKENSCSVAEMIEVVTSKILTVRNPGYDSKYKIKSWRIRHKVFNM